MKSRTITVVATAILLGCLILLVVGLLLVRARLARAAEQPLVLINAPPHNSQVWADRMTPVLVTARSRNGIARVELWVNGQLWDSQAAPREGLPTFSTALLWDPSQPGPYTLIVRALDSRGNSGQATVAVRVVADTPPDEPPVPPPTEGEGTPGHAADPGGAGEEPGGEAPPGEEEAAPGEGEPGAEEGAEEAPEPAPLGPADEVVEIGPEEVEQVTLLLEVPGLESETDYHSINCYFTVAGEETEQIVLTQAWGPFRWAPTEPISATFPWPADQPLPVRVECTGISPPVEAIPMGEPVEGEAPPDVWDGRYLHLESPGAYDFVYRVQLALGATSEEIPTPTNLRIEDVPFSPLKMLRWDWSGDEAEIDGFRLYLNGSLQWRVADPSARFTYLPPEWTSPACGQLFYFQVTAYQGAFPGGAESPPGEMAPVEPEPGRCGAVYRVTFEEMDFTPMDYPTDLPSVADADGLIGPLYGLFWAQGALLPFDTVQSDGIGVAGFRVGSGEHLYLADTIFGEPYRYHRNSLVFQWDNEWGLDLGVVALDYDWGEADDNDDHFCSGNLWEGAPPPPDFTGMFICSYFGGDDVAHVTYHLEELPEWPGGEPPPEAVPGIPRPDLSVGSWSLGPGGEILVQINNMGSAKAVPDVDIYLELNGVPLGTYTIPAGDDPAAGEWDGWWSDFPIPDYTFGSPADLCSIQITVDPSNHYMEYDEGNNTTAAADRDDVWIWSRSRPSSTEAVFDLHTTYYSCHGDPIGILMIPLVDGTTAPNFHIEAGHVHYGTGFTEVHIQYTGTDPLTTDGWRLEMVDLSTNEAFHSEERTLTEEWLP